MSIDRRLRSASNELREVALAIPEHVPHRSAARAPALVLPVLMVVFGAALAMAGLDRTPGSEPVFETAAMTQSQPSADEQSTVIDASTATVDVYDIDHELQLIRELERRPPAPRRPAGVAAPDANAERALIHAIVQRPDSTVSEPEPEPVDDVAGDADPGRPIAGLI